jgi:hypothetical protein
MTGARMWGCGAAFFLVVLSSAVATAAAEAVTVARPPDRIVVSADVGGGWTRAGFRYGGTALAW